LFWHQCLDENPWKQLPRDSENRRTLSWSEVAPIDQVKWIANVLSTDENNGSQTKEKITVNDIFVSCVTAALAKQLDYHRTRLQNTSNQSLPRQKNMHIALPVHMKGGIVMPDESVGNNIGAVVARVPGELENDDNGCVARLQAVSREMHSIKRTPAALLSHLLAKGLSFAAATVLPQSWASKLYAAANAGSVAVVSNNRGLNSHVHIKGRRLESMYGFVPLPPGLPVGVVVMSYAGNINCTVTAEQWAVPDADQFVAWILEEYLQLLEVAKAKVSK
jgi:hypothetical protein